MNTREEKKLRETADSIDTIVMKTYDSAINVSERISRDAGTIADTILRANPGIKREDVVAGIRIGCAASQLMIEQLKTEYQEKANESFEKFLKEG